MRRVTGESAGWVRRGNVDGHSCGSFELEQSMTWRLAALNIWFVYNILAWLRCQCVPEGFPHAPGCPQKPSQVDMPSRIPACSSTSLPGAAGAAPSLAELAPLIEGCVCFQKAESENPVSPQRQTPEGGWEGQNWGLSEKGESTLLGWSRELLGLRKA